MNGTQMTQLVDALLKIKTHNIMYVLDSKALNKNGSLTLTAKELGELQDSLSDDFDGLNEKERSMILAQVDEIAAIFPDDGETEASSIINVRTMADQMRRFK